ncbi:hypothetical protein AK830_g6706 [Neonectria ditissima]|uniref:SPX domain-containing protein n=1 Tax=Neonectria ditissima TaxID=78410 RepID=A0A0N8H6T5_9HYPO|nr:hypothetical protein AK830_g6706 [Neonectria ditissima]
MELLASLLAPANIIISSMRFGRNFHRWRVPTWAESYIDYARLKTIVDAKSSSLADLKEAIRFEVAIVDNFLSAQAHNIEVRIQALNEFWGIKIGSREPHGYLGVFSVELEDLQTSLLECAQHVTQCYHYSKVNHDALSRILAKAAVLYSYEDLSDLNTLPRLASHGQSYHDGPRLAQLNVTLKLVREAMESEREREAEGVQSRSLLLERCGISHFPPETMRLLYEDDLMGLDVALHRQYPESSPERQLALVRLVHIATIHRSSEPVESLDILATAISSEFTDIAMRLIQQGWGFRFVGRSGKTVLHLASEHGLSALVKSLVERGVDVNAQDIVRKRTPLVMACVHGHVDTVEALLQAGADTGIPDQQGWLAKDHSAYTFAPELNHFLDAILSVVYSHAGPDRRVIFSSFSPEVCMVLAVKQQSYPILFLNDSSNWPTGDMRATSLQTAVRFAHRFGMAGVAMASEPFVASPGLVELVKQQWLYTATCGPLNDDVRCLEVRDTLQSVFAPDGPNLVAQIQAEAGVDLIIVNISVQGRAPALLKAATHTATCRSRQHTSRKQAAGFTTALPAHS